MTLKTLPTLDAATKIAEDTLFLGRASDQTSDQKFTAELVRQFCLGGTFIPANKYSPIKFREIHGYANGQTDDGTPATHDASAGAVPSFTTAKKGSICVVTVAGTLDGNAVAKGEYLMALQDNPTTAAHWAIIADSTTEFNAAVLEAQGSEIELNGTFFFKAANSNRLPINLKGNYTILNQCGYPAIYTSDNNGFSVTFSETKSITSTVVGDSVVFSNVGTGYAFKVGEFVYCKSTSSRILGMQITAYSAGALTGTVLYVIGTGSGSSWTLSSGAAAGCIQVKCSQAGAGVGTGLDVDDETFNKLQHTTYVQMETPGHENFFHLGQMVQIFTDGRHLADAGSCFTNVGRVMSIDTTNHRVYLDRVVQYQEQIANATNIYLNALHDSTPITLRPGATLMGAPTMIGDSVGWWLTTFGDAETGTLSGSGSSRVITKTTTPNFLIGQGVRIPSQYAVQASLASKATNSATRTSNVATVGFSSAHPFTVGQTVTVAGLTAAWNGTVVITAVTSTTISYANTGSDGTAGDQVGTVVSAEDAFSTCRITAVDTGAKTITIAIPSVGDTAKTFNVQANGAITFYPAFWVDEFDSTTHGGIVVAQQAHGSEFNCDAARVWSSAIRPRFSHYSKSKLQIGNKNTHLGTDFSGGGGSTGAGPSVSWRLSYMVEAYSSACNDVEVDGSMTRHDFTTSTATSTSTWEPNFWINKCGMSPENRAKLRNRNALGAPGDTHEMSPGANIDSEIEFPASMNTAHSYRGIGAQLRSENEKRKHKQRGGQIGLRIANGASYVREPGSIDEIDLEVVDMPMRDDGYNFGSNCPTGFTMQSQASYTHKTMATGRLKFKDVPCGVKMEASTNGRFESMTHRAVGYMASWQQDASKLGMAYVDVGYGVAGGLEATATDNLTLASGSMSFTVATSLNIRAGMKCLVQDNTSATTKKANYGWGRVVSYNSGTGALVVYVEGMKGSATVSTWVISMGVIAPRYGFVMEGTCELTIGTLNWRVGECSNPTEIFHSKDSAATKTVTVGMLIIDDPLLKGIPAYVTSGRTADFNLKIGMVIYNGRVISAVGIGSLFCDVDGSGAVVTTGVKGWTTVPYDCTVANWYLAADQAGSVVFSLKRNGSAMLTAGNKPTLSSAVSGGAAASGWTISDLNAGDILEYTIDSVSTLNHVNLVLGVQKR